MKFGFGCVFSVCSVVVIGVCLAQEPKGEIEKAIDDYAKFDLEEIERVVGAFLNSTTVEERKKYIRKSERVVPLMKKYYGGEKIEAEGLSEFKKTEISYRGKFFTAVVRTEDFSLYPIAVERLANQKGVYKVDWESWVGYSEMTAEELKRNQPKNPVMVRAMLKTDSYFNFLYSDEEKWNVYKLSFRLSDETLYGYVRKGTELEGKLKKLMNGEYHNVPYTVKVAYSKDGRRKDQVEIVEFLATGWIPEIGEVGEKSE